MTCQECQDLLLLYVAGAADPDEAAAVRAHLATACPACAGELAAATATFHKIPQSLPLHAAPESAWEKIETRIALKEQAEGHGPDRVALAAPFVPPQQKTPAWLGWAAAAVVAIVMGLGWKHTADQNALNQSLIAKLTTEADKSHELEVRVVNLETRIKTLTDQNTLQLATYNKLSDELRQKIDTLAQSDQIAVTSSEQPTSSGRLYWNKKAQTWSIYLDNVKPAGPGKTYELWIVTAANQKLAAGTAEVDANGRVSFETKLPPEALTAAAVTDEPTGGMPDNGATGKTQFLALLPK